MSGRLPHIPGGTKFTFSRALFYVGLWIIRNIEKVMCDGFKKQMSRFYSFSSDLQSVVCTANVQTIFNSNLVCEYILLFSIAFKIWGS